MGCVNESHKAETFGTTGLIIGDYLDLFNRTDGFEHATEHFFIGFKIQATDKQFFTHANQTLTKESLKAKTVGQQLHWKPGIHDDKGRRDNGCYYLHEDACEATFPKLTLTFLLFYHASAKEQSQNSWQSFLFGKKSLSYQSFIEVSLSCVED
jgi:hypothetical protein